MPLLNRPRFGLAFTIAIAFGAVVLAGSKAKRAASQEMSTVERLERRSRLVEDGILQQDGKALVQLEEQVLEDGDLGALSTSDLAKLEEVSIRYSVDAQGLSYLSKAPSLSSLHFERVGPSEDCLRQIGSIKTLKRLYIVFQPVSPGDASLVVGLEHLGGLSQLDLLHVTSRGLSDDEVGDLSALRGLRALTISGSLTDSALRSIAGFSNLEQLNFSGDKFTGLGLAYFAKHPRLRELTLSGRGFHGQGLSHLSDADALRTLVLRGHAAISDEGARELGRLKRLTRLKLRGAGREGCTDMTLAAIGELPELRSLSLSNCALTDAGISKLRGCTHLEELIVYGPHLNLTDIGLGEIRQLRMLKKIVIEGGSNKFTDAEAERLASELRSLEFLFLDSDNLSDGAAMSLVKIGHLRHVGIESEAVTEDGRDALERFHATHNSDEQ